MINTRHQFNFLMILCLLFQSCNEKSEIQDFGNIQEVIDNKNFQFPDTLKELFYVKEVEVDPGSVIIDQLINTKGTGDLKDNIYLFGVNQEVYKIDSTGKIIRTLLRTGNGPGEYGMIGNIAVDENESLFIDDYNHGRILIFDSTFKYINYFNKRLKGTNEFASMKIMPNNKLVGLSTLRNEYGIYKYDIEKKEIIEKCCEPDTRAIKFNSFINAGDMDIEDEKIYFTKPHFYQIFMEDNCEEIKLLKQKSSNFVEISKKVKTVFKRKYDYSLLHKIYCEKEFFIVKFFGMGQGHDNYDIISKKGKILKENVPLGFPKHHSNFLLKYRPGKYFTFRYTKNTSGGIKLILYYLKLKKKYS